MPDGGRNPCRGHFRITRMCSGWCACSTAHIVLMLLQQLASKMARRKEKRLGHASKHDCHDANGSHSASGGQVYAPGVPAALEKAASVAVVARTTRPGAGGVRRVRNRHVLFCRISPAGLGISVAGLAANSE